MYSGIIKLLTLKDFSVLRESLPLPDLCKSGRDKRFLSAKTELKIMAVGRQLKMSRLNFMFRSPCVGLAGNHTPDEGLNPETT